MKRLEYVAYILGIVGNCNDYEEAQRALQEHGFKFLDSGCFKIAMHRPEDRYVVKLKKRREWWAGCLKPYDPLAEYPRATRIRFVPMAFCSSVLQIQARVTPCKSVDRGNGYGQDESGYNCWMPGMGDGHNGNHTHLKNGRVVQFDYED